MKKLISLICCFSIIMSMVSAVGVSAEIQTLSIKKAALLEAVEIYDTNALLDKELTKSDFAGILAKAAFAPDIDIKKMASEAKKITDLKTSDPYYDEILALYNFSYITPDSYGRFYAEDIITVDEALKMVVTTLGYSDELITTGYKTNAIGLATQKGLTKGLSAAGSSPLTRIDAYNLIYNMLLTNISDLDFLFEEKRDNINYMASRLSIYQIDGNVTCDGIISTDPDALFESDVVVIGDTELKNVKNIPDLFGLNVSAFYSYDKQADERTLLSVYKLDNKNNIITLTSKTINDFKDRTYYYTEDEYTDREKKISVPTNALIVYNEKALNFGQEFDVSMFVPENGRVRIYDNNGDNKADIVRIEDFKTGIVKFSDVDEKNIYLKNDDPIIELDNKDYRIETTEGKALDIGSVDSDSVVMYIETLDNKFVKVIVCSNYVSGAVRSYHAGDAVDNAVVVTSQGGKYEITKYAEKNGDKIELGAEYVFRFDMFGNVAEYEKRGDVDEYQIGYLVRLFHDDDDEEICYAKIFTTKETFQILKLNKKVTLIDAESNEKKYNDYVLLDELNYTGVIRYRINSSKCINYIEIPSMTIPDKEDRLYMLINTIDDENMNNYYAKASSGTINYGGQALLNANTTIFAIPNDLRDTSEYKITRTSNFAGKKNFALYLYSTTLKNRNIKVAVTKDVQTGGGNSISDEYFMTVLSVSQIYNEKNNQEDYEIVCMKYNGEKVAYLMEEEVYKEKVFSFGNANPDPVLLQPGDMLYYNLDGNYIKEAVVVYDMDWKVKDEKGNDVVGAIAGTKYSYFSPSAPSSRMSEQNYTALNGANANAWQYYYSVVQVVTGWVYSFDDDVIMITNQNPEYGIDLTKGRDEGALIELYSQGLTNGWVIEKSGKNINTSILSGKDIKPYTTYGKNCSRIVIGYRAVDKRNICIINSK